MLKIDNIIKIIEILPTIETFIESDNIIIKIIGIAAIISVIVLLIKILKR